MLPIIQKLARRYDYLNDCDLCLVCKKCQEIVEDNSRQPANCSTWLCGGSACPQHKILTVEHVKEIWGKV